MLKFSSSYFVSAVLVIWSSSVWSFTNGRLFGCGIDEAVDALLRETSEHYFMLDKIVISTNRQNKCTSETGEGYFASDRPGEYFRCVWSTAHQRWLMYIFKCPLYQGTQQIFDPVSQKCIPGVPTTPGTTTPGTTTPPTTTPPTTTPPTTTPTTTPPTTTPTTTPPTTTPTTTPAY